MEQVIELERSKGERGMSTNEELISDCVALHAERDLLRDKLLLNSDQVAWLNDALERFAHAIRTSGPSISRLPQAAQIAALVEIMEICNLRFADELARNNAAARFRELREWVYRGV